jgi:hypothetical protein
VNSRKAAFSAKSVARNEPGKSNLKFSSAKHVLSPTKGREERKVKNILTSPNLASLRLCERYFLSGFGLFSRQGAKAQSFGKDFSNP